jgi:hypothetical protein
LHQQAMLKRLTYLLTLPGAYTKMKLVIDKMDNQKPGVQPTDKEKKENLKSEQISQEKENKDTERKERCNPCMHCGVHCIFLRKE